jgi:hypothetical protein
MDITQITDVKELKSMAYDQLVIKEQADRNLQMINTRLAQLSEQELPATEEAADAA